MFQQPQLLLELGPVEDLVDASTAASGLGGVSWADSLPGGADVLRSELDLLEAVDELVQFEDEVRTVGDEDAIGRVDALLLNRLQLGEERRDVDDRSGADQVQTLGVDQAYTGSVSKPASRIRASSGWKGPTTRSGSQGGSEL